MAAPQHRPDPRGIPDVPDRVVAQESLEDLGLRIEMAELRVVRRDLEFQLHWDSLQQRGKTVLVPSRWLLPALGTGASWLFWRVVRGKRRRHERHRRDHHRAERHERRAHGEADHGGSLLHSLLGALARKDGGGGQHGHDGHASREARPEGKAERPEVGTLQLLTLLWGFMPVRIRGRVGPEITQLLLGVVAGFLQGRKQQREEARRHAEPAAGEDAK